MIVARAAHRATGMDDETTQPTKYTPESLKAMPLAQRYDAMREVIEQGVDIGDVILVIADILAPWLDARRVSEPAPTGG